MAKASGWIDFFRRVPTDLTYGTHAGGLLSVCGGFVLFMLFILEFNAFLTVAQRTSILLDDYEDELLQECKGQQNTKLSDL